MAECGMKTEYEKALDEIVKDLLRGLTTDGAHHKQFYLEKALRGLCTDEWVDKAKSSEIGWESGIPS